MKTDTSEKGLEALIVSSMTTEGGWIAGNPKDYDRSFALDLAQLRAFVAARSSKTRSRSKCCKIPLLFESN